MVHRSLVTSWRAALVLVASAIGCGGDGASPPDAAAVDAARLDAPELDAAAIDAPDLDAPSTDAPDLDAPALDAAALDARELDARELDAAEVDAALGDASVDASDDDAATGPTHLRIAAANLTSGNLQAYEAPGIRLLAGLRPDVALVQEMNYASNSDADLRSFVDQAFGPRFAYYREPGVQLPNGIVSRFPILAAGTWDDPLVGNRGFAWARIDVPGPIDLWAVSVHLLTSSPANRNGEASALVGFIQAQVPAGDYLVIGGDLNTADRSEACLTTLAAVVSVGPPHPVDQLGNQGTNASRTKPYDWVMPDPDLAPLHTASVLASSTYPTGLVLDTRVYTPLTDVAPALATDSAAPSMQHMGVVKDFALP